MENHKFETLQYTGVLLIKTYLQRFSKEVTKRVTNFKEMCNSVRSSYINDVGANTL